MESPDNDKHNILSKSSTGASDSETQFQLGNFFPYLVRIYYSAVSNAISSAYTGRYGLGVSEWRVMGVLGPYQSISASEIVFRSSLDKVAVSRAIKALQGKGYLKRDIDGDDKRRAVVRLTDEGRRVFGEIVPLVEELSEKCLEGLSSEERDLLNSLMVRVRSNAENLQKNK